MEAWRLTAGHNNVFTWKRSLDSNASHSSSVEVPCTAEDDIASFSDSMRTVPASRVRS